MNREAHVLICELLGCNSAGRPGSSSSMRFVPRNPRMIPGRGDTNVFRDLLQDTCLASSEALDQFDDYRQLAKCSYPSRRPFPGSATRQSFGNPARPLCSYSQNRKTRAKLALARGFEQNVGPLEPPDTSSSARFGTPELYKSRAMRCLPEAS